MRSFARAAAIAGAFAALGAASVDARAEGPTPVPAASPLDTLTATLLKNAFRSTPPVPRRHPGPAAAPRSAAPSPDVRMPGFETLPDGSTCLFVELSEPVVYDAKAHGTTLTYVLQGARVERRNNTNPLVTVHFNTPVSSARLVPHGNDTWFVVDLRPGAAASDSIAARRDKGKVGQGAHPGPGNMEGAAAMASLASVGRALPTAVMDPVKDGRATLRITFPKGDYLTGADTSTQPAVASDSGADASAAESP